jgi:hypothetical protein
MVNNILEKILEDLLQSYMLLSESEIDILLQQPNRNLKERIATINDLKVIIYSNDHNPPHFHVVSKDYSINAKFLIENCELISGDIKSKDLKKIKAFYLSPKTKIVMEKIWNKKKLSK